MINSIAALDSICSRQLQRLSITCKNFFSINSLVKTPTFLFPHITEASSEHNPTKHLLTQKGIIKAMTY